MEDKNKIPDNLVVHCPTENVARKVLECLNNLGYTWWTGEKYSPNCTHWETHENRTCYYIKRGVYGHIKNFTTFPIVHGEEFLRKYATTNSTLKLKKLERIKLKFTL